jgi:hypothetical protein
MQHRADCIGSVVGPRGDPVGGALCGALPLFFNEDGHDAGCNAPNKTRITRLSSAT